MKEHNLKVWPEFYAPLRAGDKTFEIRINDRDFRVDDVLILREYDPINARYTDNVTFRRISYVCKDAPGLLEGYVVLGLK